MKIQSLRRKLRLLEVYLPNATVEMIAERLGKAPKTVLDWSDRSKKSDEDSVPDGSAPALIALIQELLADRFSPERARTLFMGPVSFFENALRGAPELGLQSLIDREASDGEWSLVKDSGLSLIEKRSIRANTADPLFTIRLEEWFRLELKRDLRLFDVLALQFDGIHWGQPGSDLIELTGHLMIPGMLPDGGIDTMCETMQIGLHRFVVFATRAPIPSDLAAPPVGGGALNPAIIPALMEFYLDQSISQRLLFHCQINIVANSHGMA